MVRPCPTVVTIYDLSFALFPQYFRGFNQAYLRAGTRWSARRAARIIAISDHTRRDIHRLYDVPLERIDVAYPGVADSLHPIDPAALDRFRREKNLPEKFLLFLGTLEPRKNLVMLIEAFARFKRECADATLVLAGGVGWLADDIFAAIEASGVKDSIVLPGFVKAEEKALWLGSATAFVYPSIYEGFGLPPLEAMACGTPVIVSNAASLPEVVGDAGVSIGPRDPIEWAQAMQRVWNDAALSHGSARTRLTAVEQIHVAGNRPPNGGDVSADDMIDQPRRGLRSNAGLIGLTILALLYGVFESFVVEVSYWDGTLGVVLGLFICAQPAANLIDAFYRSRSADTDQSRWLTPLLNASPCWPALSSSSSAPRS